MTFFRSYQCKLTDQQKLIHYMSMHFIFELCLVTYPTTNPAKPGFGNQMNVFIVVDVSHPCLPHTCKCNIHQYNSGKDKSDKKKIIILTNSVTDSSLWSRESNGYHKLKPSCPDRPTDRSAKWRPVWRASDSILQQTKFCSVYYAFYIVVLRRN